MRVKKITVPEGDEYEIGALTYDQVEEIIGPNKTEMTGRVRIFNIICMGLNNPLVKRGQPGVWTPEKIMKDCDSSEIEFLTNSVLTFSNLHREQEEKLGESQSQ